MHSLTSNLQFSPSLVRSFSDASNWGAVPASIQLKSRKEFPKNPFFLRTLNCCIHGQLIPVISSNSSFNENRYETLTVAEKVHCLASEFKSLHEPIERVKRLLHYATLLPPFDESARIQENRVVGCTTMLWLKVEMDSDKLMRFRVDSDSEITKGFCSCLIWLFDGAVPEEVLSVKTDDLVEMNVGMPSRGHSRVNTWHNILSSMQKRTKKFVEVRDKDRSLIDFPPLVANPDSSSQWKVQGSSESAVQMNLRTRKGGLQLSVSFTAQIYKATHIHETSQLLPKMRDSRFSLQCNCMLIRCGF